MFSYLQTRGALLTISLIVSILLTSCTNNEGKNDLDGQLEGTLKVMYSNDIVFFQKYGNSFMGDYPDVELEVISTQWLNKFPNADRAKALKEYVEERKPDVILISKEHYSYAVDNGLLYPLDALITQDEFDLDGILPYATTWLKKHGHGGIYGLSPSFVGSAIFYNIDLFEKYDIPLPQDRMTWQDLYELAAQFPIDGGDENRIYGLTSTMISNDAVFEMFNANTRTEGLFYSSPDGKSLAIDSERWRSIYENVVNAYLSGTVFDASSSQEDLFLSGRAAMIWEGSYYLNMISQAEGKTGTKINWGIVTPPVSSQDPDVNNSIHLNGIFGVNAESSNKKLAWEFVKYVNEEKVAKTLTRTIDGSLSVRTAFIGEKDGNSMSPFYTLTKESDLVNHNVNLPEGFDSIFAHIVQKETASVLEGEQTIDEAYQRILEQGTEHLKQAHLRAEIADK